MSTDWEAEAGKEESGFTEKVKMEVGVTHEVTIIRAIHTKNDGEEMTDRDGNPQLMIVFANDEGHEHVGYFALGGRWAWKFAKLVIAAGLNIAQLKIDGIGFEDFADNDFASENLSNRTLRLELYQNGAWVNANTLPSEAAAPEAVEELPVDDNEPIDPNSIPF
jgi:hypothetical protein